MVRNEIEYNSSCNLLIAVNGHEKLLFACLNKMSLKLTVLHE